jgi:hypothetical protein
MENGLALFVDGLKEASSSAKQHRYAVIQSDRFCNNAALPILTLIGCVAAYGP